MNWASVFIQAGFVVLGAALASVLFGQPTGMIVSAIWGAIVGAIGGFWTFPRKHHD